MDVQMDVSGFDYHNFSLFWSHTHIRRNIEYSIVIRINEEYAHDEKNQKLFS